MVKEIYQKYIDKTINNLVGTIGFYIDTNKIKTGIDNKVCNILKVTFKSIEFKPSWVFKLGKYDCIQLNIHTTIIDNPSPYLEYIICINHVPTETWMVCEKLSITLSDMVRAKTFNENNINTLAHHLYNGVQHLHNLGIIHADIKENNIMYCFNQKKFKLIDFGHSIYNNSTNKDYRNICKDRLPYYLLHNKFFQWGFGVDYWAIGCVIQNVTFGYNIYTKLGIINDPLSKKIIMLQKFINKLMYSSEYEMLCVNFLKMAEIDFINTESGRRYYTEIYEKNREHTIMLSKLNQTIKNILNHDTKESIDTKLLNLTDALVYSDEFKNLGVEFIYMILIKCRHFGYLDENDKPNFGKDGGVGCAILVNIFNITINPIYITKKYDDRCDPPLPVILLKYKKLLLKYIKFTFNII